MKNPTKKPHICNVCGKSFDTKEILTRHEKLHENSHTCNVCGQSFGRLDNLQRHEKSHEKPHICNVCGKSFGRRDILTRHEKIHTKQPTQQEKQDKNDQEPPIKKQRIQVHFECKTCGASFENIEELTQHIQTHPLNTAEEEAEVDQNDVQDGNPTIEQALKGSLKVVTFHPAGQQILDLPQFLADMKDDISQYLQNETTGIGAVKWYMVCAIKFVKFDDNGTNLEKVDTVGFIHSRAIVKLPGEDEDLLNESINLAFFRLFNNCENFKDLQGTGWVIDEILHLKLMMGKYKPLKGSQYIELPAVIRNNKAILNIQNTDDKCFLWCILAFLHEVSHGEHPHRVTKYIHYENELNMDGISYPVATKDVPKFVKQNNISVNIFGFEESFYPLFISKPQKDKHVNLLLIEEDGKTHYCLIKDLNRMLHSQSKHKGRKYFCTYCLHGFTSENLLMKHKPVCETHGLQVTQLPGPKEQFMSFKQVGKMLKVPFVIYADFECILQPLNKDGKKNIHKPCGYSYLVVSAVDEDQPKIVTYSDENVLEHFFEDMMRETNHLIERLKTNIPMIFTPQDEVEFNATHDCHICGQYLQANDKVRDHCHLTGKYRGAAHFKCNLAFRYSKFIPVFFHNLEGYDSHLIMQELGKYKEQRIGCIPKNMEKYISFNLGHIRFLDSLNFMNESLARLVNNLAAEGDQHFQHIKRHFPDQTERALLLRKGVYPYEWMDDEEKMNYPCLPAKESFYSSLTLEGITEEDYSHAQNVWKTFKMKTMKDYHDLYLKSDVLLLADCFENFRKKCLEFYKLDPAHFYTTPGLSWNAALKMTNVTLELLTDIDMHLMIEKGVRGGVSTIVTRYDKANNKYMPDYDPKEKSVYLLDLDANNLYGWAMSQPLPTDTFTWVSEEDLDELSDKIMELEKNAQCGYILEVDLEIPEDKHDYFNHYVPAPEHMEVTEDMLSPFNSNCMNSIKMKHTKTSKLIPNLQNKEKYVIHYRALQCYLALGLKLTKIHRAVQFQQSPWLKQYIDFNTHQRKLAKNTFEKNFFKLMNNSVFGKVSDIITFILYFILKFVSSKQ